MNLNANKLFKLTGALPPRPPDTRGTTEKAQDLEGSKVALRQKLGTVTDGVIASQIIGELADAEILFALNKWEIINRDMKEQYAKGVPSSVFIAYLRRLIQRFENADAVQQGLQQNTGEAIIMSNIQLLYGLPQKQIYSLVKSTVDRVAQQFGNSPLMDNVREQVAEQERMIPTAEDLRIKDSLTGGVKDEADVVLNELYKSFPVSDDLVAQIGELNLAMARRDAQLARQALFQLLNITSPQDATKQLVERFDAIIFNEARRRAGVPTGTPTGKPMGTQTRPAPVRGRRRARSAEPAPTAPPETIPTPLVFRPDPEAGNPATAFRQAEDDPRLGIRRGVGRYEPAEAPPDLEILTRPQWKKLSKQEKGDKLNLFFREVPNMTAFYTLPSGELTDEIAVSGTTIDPNDFTEENLNEIFDVIKPMVDSYVKMTTKGKAPRTGGRYNPTGSYNYEAQGEGGTPAEAQARFEAQMRKKGKMSGRGLVKPYKQSIKHLLDKPVEKPKPYIQFGRYFLNKERLKNKGFLSLRVASGNVIKGLATEKVSNDLAKVLLTLIAGQTPSYEDIGSLTQEDRRKLSHICSSCQVDSPAVPQMKGEGEAEMDKFNILKGEIIAGNDAPKIAREFKTMLLKFMTEGRIPRQQGNEILHQMLSLGV
jgi:hypothetical protein